MTSAIRTTRLVSQIAYELAAGLRFQEGVDDHLTPLDTHRMLYGAQQRPAMPSSAHAQQPNIINLWRKALGGGWRNTKREKQRLAQ